jgi:alanine dehydrogenase
MIIGVPKEVKEDEYRVGLTPVGVEIIRQAGHSVLVETQAGAGSGIRDAEYSRESAEIVDSGESIWQRADMVIKVKEPQAEELAWIRAGQIVFTYFHFAASRDLTDSILETGCVAIAYETIEDSHGRLPLLTPMSEVAGKMSIQEGAKYLERPMMGRGILLGGIPGVPPAEVLILGGGVVGTNAAKVAAGLGARVVIMDIDLERLRYLSDVMPANVRTIFSEPQAIRDHLTTADLVIGALLIPGARCPMLVTRESLKGMKPGSVIVDVGVDQGGCTETTRPTTHSDPTYVVDGVVHYCVANMPGAVGRTSTLGLTNATLPYALQIANDGYRKAAGRDPGLAMGVNIERGCVTNKAVADTFELELAPLSS